MTNDRADDWCDLCAAYAASALTPEECAGFERHLTIGCPQCVAQLPALERAVSLMLSATQAVQPAPAIFDTLMSRINAAPLPLNRHDPAAGSQPTEAASVEHNQAGTPHQQVWRQWDSDKSDHELLTIRADAGGWEPTGVDGVLIRRLFVDRDRNQFTGLVRMSPGSQYPRHLHDGAEECLVLSGDLHVGDIIMRQGDYQRAPAGSIHGIQWTESGCELLIVSSLTDEML